ncbi:MAG: hypothetical protein US50_C0011G0004 [Candidatus Nomurabacteria bacterium GW2011_GWB1_37_5]|uniref:DUF5667 domain-containing protein n=1 Tax=Candidatus Nomurabacteria bacterium GW2011_GWB1_37_5 TaxID=1618742 RepID=A0A0G0K4Q5_9BACT|nr:MAG: hypothetical protein US50_C0011G0004 [Candidatus Nomurabacteria bacterium GW2011_GWB1_37_5]
MKKTLFIFIAAALMALPGVLSAQNTNSHTYSGDENGFDATSVYAGAVFGVPSPILFAEGAYEYFVHLINDEGQLADTTDVGLDAGFYFITLDTNSVNYIIGTVNDDNVPVMFGPKLDDVWMSKFLEQYKNGWETRIRQKDKELRKKRIEKNSKSFFSDKKTLRSDIRNLMLDKQLLEEERDANVKLFTDHLMLRKDYSAVIYNLNELQKWIKSRKPNTKYGKAIKLSALAVPKEKMAD